MPPKAAEKAGAAPGAENPGDSTQELVGGSLRGELQALRASIDKENEERFAAHRQVNEQRLAAVQKENERILRELDRKDREVRKIAQRASRDAKARADQRGVYRQADLLEDIETKVEGAKKALENASHLVVSELVVVKVRVKALVEEADFAMVPLSESVEAVKDVLVMLAEAVDMIDERRAELEVLSQAPSREEGYVALSIMNQTTARSNLEEAARNALKQAGEAVKAKEREKEKSKKDKGKGGGKDWKKRRFEAPWMQAGPYSQGYSQGYTQSSVPIRPGPAVQAISGPVQNQSMSSGFLGGAGGPGPCWNCGQVGHRSFQCQQPRRGQ
jgi:hypothetical protein